MEENLLQSALLLSISALTLLVRQQEGHPACKEVGCWIEGGDNLTGALHVIAPVVTIVLSSNKIQNGDNLVLANSSAPGKMPLKRRESALLQSILNLNSLRICRLADLRLSELRTALVAVCTI